ncbi:putative DNA glycosylase At3g47830-like protein 1 [Colletotrichum chlorophyti]|uniref:Putative DNA glycosylase At3g47830-like protein 1 n=1 Tax=Colletotrichum chlorophyti TaxID=708187 RepID=A0A1Q8S4V1_9PEZI|nr:putative DNA glycosylase At3g47830-like protein 1 [Colletotrichum chlorophyti]
MTQRRKRAKKTNHPTLSLHDDDGHFSHGLGSIDKNSESSFENDNTLAQVPHDKNISKAIKSDKITEKAVYKAAKLARVSKNNPYGLMPGSTPFPQWEGPSAEQCQTVHDILTEKHGEFTAPSKIPPPSTSVAGCGEVPDVVDAMMRTMVSQHTTMENANKAISNVSVKFGQLETTGVSAGIIDWNKVRLMPEEDLKKAITPAGLINKRAKDMKLCLDSIYEENQFRRSVYLREKETGEAANVSGAAQLTQGQKDYQLRKIESGILTMDHVRGMTRDEAMFEFTKYRGIGVKTASCLVLFCLQLPSFAVDTHVWRLCKWLKWVPANADRDKTYKHCEVKVPDHLKYGLHQLLICHGKNCQRCDSNTVRGTRVWAKTVCPLEHLVDRFDKRTTKAHENIIKKKIVSSALNPKGSVDTVVEQETISITNHEEAENNTPGPEVSNHIIAKESDGTSSNEKNPILSI